MKRQLPEPAIVPIAKKTRVDGARPFIPASTFGLDRGMKLVLEKHRIVLFPSMDIISADAQRALRSFVAQEGFAGVALYTPRLVLLSVGLTKFEPHDRDAPALRLLADLQKHGIAAEHACIMMPPANPSIFRILLNGSPRPAGTEETPIDAAIVLEDTDS